MKFWTIQSENVDNIINEKGYYEADISKSWYLAQECGSWRKDIVDSLDLAELKQKIAFDDDHDLRDLYTLILKSFNKTNKTDLKGLVFAFALFNPNTQQLIEIQTIDELYYYLQTPTLENIFTTMRHRIEQNEKMVVYEVNYNSDYNPLYVDYSMYELLSIDNSERIKVFDKRRYWRDLWNQITGYDNQCELNELCDIVLNSISKGKFCETGLWFQLSRMTDGLLPIIQAHLPNLTNKNIIKKYQFKL